MYQAQFSATSSADWAEAVELIDANTNLALDVDDDATFELQVDDDCGASRLTASTAEGTLTRPQPNVVQWQFTPEQHGGLRSKNTYRVGLTMTTAGGTIQIFTGTLAYLDGIVS